MKFISKLYFDKVKQNNKLVLLFGLSCIATLICLFYFSDGLPLLFQGMLEILQKLNFKGLLFLPGWIGMMTIWIVFAFYIPFFVFLIIRFIKNKKNHKKNANKSSVSEKFIKKIFYKKVIFKIFTVLTAFWCFGTFVSMCNTYHNPYDYSYYKNQKYNNTVEFLENVVEPMILQRDYFSRHNITHYYDYTSVFAFQMKKKGIFSGNPGPAIYTAPKNILETVYSSCAKNKMSMLEREYKRENNSEYTYTKDNIFDNDYPISVDCRKALTIPLEPEPYYLIKHELFGYLIVSLVYTSFGMLFLWFILKLFIFSPILWILKKDEK